MPCFLNYHRERGGENKLRCVRSRPPGPTPRIVGRTCSDFFLSRCGKYIVWSCRAVREARGTRKRKEGRGVARRMDAVPRATIWEMMGGSRRRSPVSTPWARHVRPTPLPFQRLSVSHPSLVVPVLFQHPRTPPKYPT